MNTLKDHNNLEPIKQDIRGLVNFLNSESKRMHYRNLCNVSEIYRQKHSVLRLYNIIRIKRNLKKGILSDYTKFIITNFIDIQKLKFRVYRNLIDGNRYIIDKFKGVSITYDTNTAKHLARYFTHQGLYVMYVRDATDTIICIKLFVNHPTLLHRELDSVN